MYRLLSFLMIMTATLQGNSYGQDCATALAGRGQFEDELILTDHDPYDIASPDSDNQLRLVAYHKFAEPGQTGGGAAGGGAKAGAADATDPSAILTQFQMQNVFTAETYDASGYSNTLILQPVLPFPVVMPGLKEIFPNHIIRPTLPIIAPTANPDGPLGVEGGLGDLTILDVAVRPVKGFGNLLFGYTAILPTATHPQLALRQWQLGPAAGFIYKEIPKTILGFLYQQPFSLQGRAQRILIQPVYVRHLPNEWYIGWGEFNWVFNTETGDYNIPLNFRVGKVVKLGHQPINIFVEPFYTPEGLRRGPASEWGVKLNVTFLFPEKKLDPLLGCLFDRQCNCRHNCRHH
jgi:hypothetical protein